MPLDKTKQIAEVHKRLKKLYPDAQVELDYTNPFELMVASILAAQNRDTTINKITADLFRKYHRPEDYFAAPIEELEVDIHKSGFFRQKAKSLKAVSQKLIDDFNGEVPRTMAELLTLPGIGRKTATVVLGEAMGIAEGITVDVHHLRVEPRLGISNQKLADRMEKELMENLPQSKWIAYGQEITWHGRRVCHAQKPDCPNCVLNDICPSSQV